MKAIRFRLIIQYLCNLNIFFSINNYKLKQKIGNDCKLTIYRLLKHSKVLLTQNV